MSGLHSRAKGTRGTKGSTRPKGSMGPKGLRGSKTRRPKSSKGVKGSKGPKRSKGLRGPKRSSGTRLGGIRNRSGVAPLASRKKPAGKAKPRTKPKRTPPSPAARRHRIPLTVAALFALAVLGTSFPLSTLLAQHSQLSSTAGQLHQLQSENRLLAEQDQQLNSSAEIDRLARQDYQLVMPGQTLYDVLPPSGRSGDLAAGGTMSGDPGDQPLVAPADAPDMTPDPGLPQASTPSGTAGTAGTAGSSGTSASAGSSGSGVTGSGSSAAKSTSGGTGSAPAPSSFWSRVTNTLEFWK